MNTNVAAMLRKARKASGLTQAALARSARTSQPAVAAYEAGTRTPTLATLERLLAACRHTLIIGTRPQQPELGTHAREALREHREALVEAAASNGVANIRIFGSVARGAVGPNDIDLLVDLEPGRTLVDLAAFRDDATTILGVPVDVASIDVLKPSVRAEALRDAVPL